MARLSHLRKLKFNIISRALFANGLNFIGMFANNLDYIKFASRPVLGFVLVE